MRLAVVLAAAMPLFALAHPNGAPPGHTGGFAEPDCRVCHLGPETTAKSALRVPGLPDNYQPGNRYRLIVELALNELASEQLVQGGFQLSIRSSSSNTAGTLTPVAETLQEVQNEGATYLTHTAPARKADEHSPLRWPFAWTPPERLCEPVQLHLAAVAGNDDASPLGDKVFTLQRTLAPKAENCP